MPWSGKKVAISQIQRGARAVSDLRAGNSSARGSVTINGEAYVDSKTRRSPLFRHHAQAAIRQSAPLPGGLLGVWRARGNRASRHETVRRQEDFVQRRRREANPARGHNAI